MASSVLMWKYLIFHVHIHPLPYNKFTIKYTANWNREVTYVTLSKDVFCTVPYVLLLRSENGNQQRMKFHFQEEAIHLIYPTAYTRWAISWAIKQVSGNTSVQTARKERVLSTHHKLPQVFRPEFRRRYHLYFHDLDRGRTGPVASSHITICLQHQCTVFSSDQQTTQIHTIHIQVRNWLVLSSVVISCSQFSPAHKSSYIQYWGMAMDTENLVKVGHMVSEIWQTCWLHITKLHITYPTALSTIRMNFQTKYSGCILNSQQTEKSTDKQPLAQHRDEDTHSTESLLHQLSDHGIRGTCCVYHCASHIATKYQSSWLLMVSFHTPVWSTTIAWLHNHPYYKH